MDLDHYNRRKIFSVITFGLLGGMLVTYIGMITKVFFLLSVIILHPFQLNFVLHAYKPIIAPYQQNIHCCLTALIPGGGRAFECFTAEHSEAEYPWLTSFRPKIVCEKLCPGHNSDGRPRYENCF